MKAITTSVQQHELLVTHQNADGRLQPNHCPQELDPSRLEIEGFTLGPLRTMLELNYYSCIHSSIVRLGQTCRKVNLPAIGSIALKQRTGYRVEKLRVVGK